MVCQTFLVHAIPHTPGTAHNIQHLFFGVWFLVVKWKNMKKVRRPYNGTSTCNEIQGGIDGQCNKMKGMNVTRALFSAFKHPGIQSGIHSVIEPPRHACIVHCFQASMQSARQLLCQACRPWHCCSGLACPYSRAISMELNVPLWAIRSLHGNVSGTP